MGTRSHHHYKLTDFGSFGGPGGGIVNPSSRVLNNRGEVIGVGDTSAADPFAPNCFLDCLVNQAFLASHGTVFLLNPPPDDAGLSSIPTGINSKGQVIGQTQTGIIDPATGWPGARGVFWQDGQAREIPTLGGTQAVANSINDSGYVVGSAFTATPDPFANSLLNGCVFLPTTGFSLCLNFTFAQSATFFPGTTETHAFLWRPHGSVEDLGTLGGPDSAAWIINDRGEVAGWSFTSFLANPATGVPNMDPFLWSPATRKMKDLGTLGGSFGAPFWMNSHGQVVGSSNLAGDNANDPFLWNGETMKDLGTFGGSFGVAYSINDSGEVVGTASIPSGLIFAFSWKDGVMKNLGTVDGDQCSQAFSINGGGHIVGVSDNCDSGADLHGFLVENGQPMVDLNTLIVPATADTVVSAVFINDRGEIGCILQLPGSFHACVLTPCDEDHPDVEGCDYGLVDSASAAEVRAPLVPAVKPAANHELTSADRLARIRSMMAVRHNRFGVALPK
jgi:probable HAF family extracellular repeat protein